jgi:hypothetical protein
MRVCPPVTPNYSDGHQDTLYLSDPKPSGFYDPHAYGRGTAETLLSAATEMTDLFIKRDNDGVTDQDPRRGFVRLSDVNLENHNPLGTSEPASGYLTPDSIEVISQQTNGGLTGIWSNSRDGEIQDITRVFRGFNGLYADCYTLNPDGSCTVMDNIESLYG